MGQITQPAPPSILYSTVDRLTAPNSAAGLSLLSQNVIIFGENAGLNLDQSDIIVMGKEAFKNVQSVDARYSVVVGEGSFPNRGNFTADKLVAPGGVIIIGGNNLPLIPGTGTAARLAGTIAIGIGILNLAPFDSAGVGNYARNLLIGNGVFSNNTMNGSVSSSDNVVLGHQACYNDGNPRQYLNVVVIGSRSGPQGIAGHNSNHVVIGTRAGQQLGGSAGNIIIGALAGNSMSGTGGDNILIGTSSNQTSGAQNVVIGSSITSAAINDCTFVGFSIGNGSPQFSGARIIALGRGAGAGANGATSDQLFIETNDGATPRSWIYGSPNGNLTLGTTVTLAQRDLATIAAQNAVKLYNGARGAGNPVNGGFFYVAAGALHWVGSAGTDSVVAPA